MHEGKRRARARRRGRLTGAPAPARPVLGPGSAPARPRSRPAGGRLSVGCGTISQVSSKPDATQRLRDLARLRRVRDRIDREYAQPLDVEALARGAHMSAGHLSRQFKQAYGESPYAT